MNFRYLIHGAGTFICRARAYVKTEADIVSCDMRTASCFLFVVIFIPSCMDNTVKFEYADGSANRYIIYRTALEYDPIRPEESSTGTYSGGEPKSVPITTEQYESIRTLFEKAINNSDIQIQDRIKTSGAISVMNGKEKTRYILAPGCDELKAIETRLKELLIK